MTYVKGSGKQEIYSINVLQFIVLFANVLQALEDKDIGYADIDLPIRDLMYRLKNTGQQIKHDQLESALWSCVMQQEAGKFWHPEGKTLREFINSMMHPNYSNVHFHEIYCKLIPTNGVGRPKKEE